MIYIIHMYLPMHLSIPVPSIVCGLPNPFLPIVLYQAVWMGCLLNSENFTMENLPIFNGNHGELFRFH